MWVAVVFFGFSDIVIDITGHTGTLTVTGFM
jgi:hypothetical protein